MRAAIRAEAPGIQADLKTFAAHGVYGTSAITAVTAQNTERVTAFTCCRADMVTAQIDAVASDIRIDAVKTGMLGQRRDRRGRGRGAEALAIAAGRGRSRHGAKSGDHLLEPAAVAALREGLLPLAHVVTPNRPEAEVLDGAPGRTAEDAREAARRIVDAAAGRS